jgi:hypothetical protein
MDDGGWKVEISSLKRGRVEALAQHLDSIQCRHHDAALRTTVTLDKDFERMLRDVMHRSA